MWECECFAVIMGIETDKGNATDDSRQDCS